MCKTVHERKRIAGHLLHILGSLGDVGLQGPFRHVLEAVRAGLLVRQRGAHPRLHVAHLEQERPAAGAGGAAQLAHLGERIVNLAHSFVEVGEAVVKSGRGSRVGAVVGLAGDVGDVSGHAPGLSEADADGYLG